MGQRYPLRIAAVFFLLAASLLPPMLAGGCRRSEKSAPVPPRATRLPTVASLVPAATSLIVGMGAADHLVGISNWDIDAESTHVLPRVGDYQTIDWEKLADLHPSLMITQFGDDRLPPGLQERADRLNIKLLNVQIERVQDVFKNLTLLGQAINEPDKATTTIAHLRAQLAAVEHQVANQPPVPTLIVIDDQGQAVIGSETFLDDLLHIAGGANVAASFHRYPSIDREQLLKLAPDVVIQLLPAAPENVLHRAAAFWKTLPNLPAVQNDRVYPLTDATALLPGTNVGDLAEQFAVILHPNLAANRPAALKPTDSHPRILPSQPYTSPTSHRATHP